MSSLPKFSHKFSGISVWLEPDPSDTSSLREEMEYLAQQCGGPEAGMHGITPHCTLLYNTSFPPHHCDDEEPPIDSNNAKLLRQVRDGEDLLRRCLRDYRMRQNGRCDRSSSENSSGGMSFDGAVPKIKMIPTSQYYFPYPKTADGGKGFGCCIPLLILETTPELKALQEATKANFPPDERHGDENDHTHNQQQKGDQQKAQEEAKFRPHMALVYAPENHGKVRNGWLEERSLRMERQKRYLNWTSAANGCKNSNGEVVENCEKGIAETKCEEQNHPRPAAWNAKYLSVWSTEGTLDEWFPIAKVDLLQP